MRRLIALVAVTVVGVLGTAGCGHDQTRTTVGVRDIDGVGRALVDSSGRTLYFADQESGGTIYCVDSCLSFWKPLTIAVGTHPTASADLSADLATLSRPDGSAQVTYHGHPLYTFQNDRTGHAGGNGVTDQFGSTTFIWHAAMATGAAVTTEPDDNPGYGY